MGLYKKIKSELLKVIYLTFGGIFILPPSYIFSQISEGGIPPSFSYQVLSRSAAIETEVPVDFYIEDLRETDNWRAREGAPMPVSTLIPVDYSTENAGYCTTLPGGEKIWRLHLKAKGAVAIMLYYSDFYIPEGGKLFIYSADKLQLLGAYTHQTHPSGGLFATEFIGGDALILEYVYPETSVENPRIIISEIGYGYNTAALRHFCGITTRSTSGTCMVDINCEEGDAWQREKKGICHTVQRIGRTNYICSASLMNNTAEDFTPFLLTARHCASGDGVFASESDMAQWTFYFNMEREGCGNEYLPTVTKTMTGCTMVATTGMEGGSDGMLLLLNEMIPESYDVFYNGWDIRDVTTSSGVSIHHPSGDYKKISTFNEKANTYTFVSSEFNGDKNAHLNVIFSSTANGHSVTEGGSSGAPLYNENKLIVGTLTGGNSSCSYNVGLNLYGKMSYHWDKYKTDSTTRMDVWLDPLEKGFVTFPGRFRKIIKPSPVDLNAVNTGQKVAITWSAPRGDMTPKLYNVYRNNNKIGETTLLTFIDNEPIDGSIIYSVSAVYADGEESLFATTTLSYVKYNAPFDLTAARVSEINNDVKLSWKAPVYEQSIYWGTMENVYHGGFNGNKFYYGQKWSAEDISPLNSKTIKAVRFIPIINNTYKIFISQGSQTYRQDINSTSLKYSKIDTIMLDKPFIIDGTKSLIISIQVSEVGENSRPAVCDAGPAVDGKGNIYSFDGENWYKIYNESKPDDNNFNFVISAIVSSESGTFADNGSSDVSTQSSEAIIGHNENHSRMMKYDIIDNYSSVAVPFSLRKEAFINGSVPAAFPEITSFRIYRCHTNCSSYKDVNASETTFMENTSLDYSYVVTAFYGGIESDYSNRAKISPVDVENVNTSVDLFPSRFSGFVYLKGNEHVARVEVFSVYGKICLVVNNPGNTIDTSSLPPGLYFFRLYDSNNRQKVVKAIKTK